MDDRTGDELREEGDEERVVGEAVFARLALVRVDQVGDLLEGEEGDRQRQDDGVEVKVGAGEGVEAADGEVGVFEVAEQAEVEDDAGDQPDFAGVLSALSVRLVEQAAEAEVGEHRHEQQHQINRPPPRVEEQRGQHQPDDRRLMPAPGDPEVAGEGEGQEEEEEFVGVEEHRRVGVAGRRLIVTRRRVQRFARRLRATQSRR